MISYSLVVGAPVVGFVGEEKVALVVVAVFGVLRPVVDVVFGGDWVEPAPGFFQTFHRKQNVRMKHLAIIKGFYINLYCYCAYKVI